MFVSRPILSLRAWQASALVAACAFASAPAPLAADAFEDSRFIFAEHSTPEWDLRATTSVNWRGNIDGPWTEASSVECFGESPQASFKVDGTGDLAWIHIKFLSDPDSDGERKHITSLADHLWLFIDGERWEYANISTRPRGFSNVEYPDHDVDIIAVWAGYQAVRKGEGQPWINFRLLYDRLLKARKVQWAFKSRDWELVDKDNPESQLPRDWRSRRYLVDRKGLTDAFFWCARQVSSESAHVLPDRLLKKVKAAK